MSTYTITAQGQTFTRNSATKTYTHGVVVITDSGKVGVHRWSQTEAAAAKYARSLADLPWAVEVVAVDAPAPAATPEWIEALEALAAYQAGDRRAFEA